MQLLVNCFYAQVYSTLEFVVTTLPFWANFEVVSLLQLGELQLGELQLGALPTCFWRCRSTL